MTTTTRLLRWAKRVALVTVIGAASITLASPAQAYIPPGPSSVAGTPGAFTTTLVCSSGSIYIQPHVAVQNGYYQGQWVTYRYALWSSLGHRGWTSGWASAQLLPYSSTPQPYVTWFYPRTPLAAYTRATVQSGAYWEVAVQIGWYRPGYGWTYSSWTTPDGYRSGYINYLPSGGIRDCRS